MGKIFYIMGKSASGKDTIYKRIKEILPELKGIITYTTRPVREGEVEGREYHFVTNIQLEELKQSGKMIELREYNTAHGIWKYSTIDDGQFDTEDDILTIGTLESYSEIRKYFGKDRVIPIYIVVDDLLRLERAVEREKSQANPKVIELCRRFLADHEDFNNDKLIEAGIEHKHKFSNINLEICTNKVIDFIKSYRNN